MAITVRRYLTPDSGAAMRHLISVRQHLIPTDVNVDDGGADSGLDPHDLYDAALGACKALTVLWYANKKHIAIENIDITIDRDNAQERAGTYKLTATLDFSGELTQAQRNELLSVAAKCPIHKLMTQTTTEVITVLKGQR
jgi:putative redox protein